MAVSSKPWVIFKHISKVVHHHPRSYSSQTLTNSDVRKKRVQLFEKEQQRQLNLVTRVEKIQVKHVGVPENCTLIMNRHLSTPYNCAMHIQELLTTRSALALVNGQPWDMHRPLVEDCELNFLHFEDEDPRIVNNAFWKTCSFILGHVLETAFQDKFYVELCSFPPPNVSSGSFVYDADLKVGDWTFSQTELNCLSRIGLRLSYEDLKFQRLDIPVSLAQEMFSHNRFKSQQIPSIADKSRSGSTVTVYRLGDHVDISSGPLISSSSQIGRFSVCAIHGIESDSFGKLHRVQGLALPTQLLDRLQSNLIPSKCLSGVGSLKAVTSVTDCSQPGQAYQVVTLESTTAVEDLIQEHSRLTLHSWTYDTILRPRAAKLNHGPMPQLKATRPTEQQLIQ